MTKLPSRAELCEGLSILNGDFILLLSDGDRAITMRVPPNFHQLTESAKIDRYIKPALAHMASE